MAAMNPVLVQAIRNRMREQTTDELSSLWTTNDRVTWSPETFEALKSLLAERGVSELPAQNDPAPLVKSLRPSDLPENLYWLGWLKPVLWITIAVTSITLASVALGAWVMRDELRGLYPDVLVGTPMRSLLGIFQTLGLPTLMLGGSIACLRLVPGSRQTLLAASCLSIPIVSSNLAHYTWDSWRDGVWYSYALGNAVSSAHQLVLPAVLIALLRRPEIRRAFGSQGTGFDLGFDQRG